MELHAYIPRMTLQLHNLHSLTLVSLPNGLQIRVAKTVDVFWINFIAGSMPLVDLFNLDV